MPRRPHFPRLPPRRLVDAPGVEEVDPLANSERRKVKRARQRRRGISTRWQNLPTRRPHAPAVCTSPLHDCAPSRPPWHRTTAVPNTSVFLESLCPSRSPVSSTGQLGQHQACRPRALLRKPHQRSWSFSARHHEGTGDQLAVHTRLCGPRSDHQHKIAYDGRIVISPVDQPVQKDI